MSDRTRPVRVLVVEDSLDQDVEVGRGAGRRHVGEAHHLVVDDRVQLTCGDELEGGLRVSVGRPAKGAVAVVKSPSRG
jgi:hypothetical protein